MNVYQIIGLITILVLITGTVLFFMAGTKPRKRGVNIEELTFITPEVAGIFTWKMSPQATKLLKKYGDGQDPAFAEHHVNKFLFLTMASMIASTPERKQAARAIIEQTITECEDRMEAALCTKKAENPDVEPTNPAE